MKAYKYTFFTALTLALLVSCSDNSDSIGESQIDTSTPILNDIDVWLRANFVAPYNIEVLYKWNINNADIDRFLHPPLESSVVPMAEALQKIWIEPFTEVGGADFIKNIAPRQVVMVGSRNYLPGNPNLRQVGAADSGKTITLFEIDYLDFTDINSVKQPLKTLQHEYAHILNFIIPFNPIYAQINPADYDSNWFNRSLSEARELGFITEYAGSQVNDDFVEMVSEMLTLSKEDFDAIVDGITSDRGRAIIRQKEALVADYYKSNFGIDIYELQILTEAATQELVN